VDITLANEDEPDANHTEKTVDGCLELVEDVNQLLDLMGFLDSMKLVKYPQI